MRQIKVTCEVVLTAAPSIIEREIMGTHFVFKSMQYIRCDTGLAGCNHKGLDGYTCTLEADHLCLHRADDALHAAPWEE